MHAATLACRVVCGHLRGYARRAAGPTTHTIEPARKAPLRISVLGNSDTSGMLLNAGEQSWPSLLRERLSESLDEDVVVDSWRWAPFNPDAVPRALSLIDAAEPDIVVVTLASFWCTVGTVRAGIDRRFGKRAGRLYGRAEGAFRQRFEQHGPPGTAANGLGRRTARRILGASTYMSLDAFIAVYSDLIRELSQRENLQVLVCGDHHFNARLRRRVRAIAPAIEGIEAAIRPLVRERKLDWGDVEEAISVGGRREEMISFDGVHMTPEAHERVAQALLPVLTAMAVRP